MSKLKPRITENGIDYILVGDYYIPGLKLPEEHRPIGKYGRMHREYLREVHPARLNTLTLTGELWTYSFYCGTYKRSGKDYCTPHTLPFQVLNDIVLGDLKQIIRNVENLQELVKSQSFTATKIRKSTDIELTKLKAELERVKKLKKSIYEDYKDELISKEEFLSYREDYQQKETLYSKQIETLEEKKKESVTEDVFETPWLRRLLELKDIEELDRDIIVEMIDQITVYENRKLKISYNFGNELEHLFSSVYCEDLEKKAI